MNSAMGLRFVLTVLMAQFALLCVSAAADEPVREGVRWAETTSEGMLGVSYGSTARYSVWTYEAKEGKTKFLAKGLEVCSSIVDGSTPEHVVFARSYSKKRDKDSKSAGRLLGYSYIDGKTGAVQEIPKEIAGISPGVLAPVWRVFSQTGEFLCKQTDMQNGETRYIKYSLSDFKEKASSKPKVDSISLTGKSLLLSPDVLLLTARISHDEGTSNRGFWSAVVPVRLAGPTIDVQSPVTVKPRVYGLGHAGDSAAIYAFGSEPPFAERIVFELKDGKYLAKTFPVSGHPFSAANDATPVGAWKDWIIFGDFAANVLRIWKVSTGEYLQPLSVTVWDSDFAEVSVSEFDGSIACFGKGSKIEVFTPSDVGYPKAYDVEIPEK